MSEQWQVLVIDDDFRVAGMHADLVESVNGFTVAGMVCSVAEARSSIAEAALDLLHAEVYLPDGDGELAAADAAERAGVSRATAQRRLAAMASEGAVHVRLRYGRSGRPEHLYSRRRGGLSPDEA